MELLASSKFEDQIKLKVQLLVTECKKRIFRIKLSSIPHKIKSGRPSKNIHASFILFLFISIIFDMKNGIKFTVKKLNPNFYKATL